MSGYRDITVNIHKPRTLRDHTAVVILDTLQRATAPVLAGHLYDAIEYSKRGELAHMAEAIKGLRNLGYEIECNKARHLSSWWLNPTPAETEKGRQRRIKEAYSQAVTTARSIAGALSRNPGDMTLAGSHRHAVQCAIDLGSDVAVGMTIQEVVNDCQPLTV